jgi:hypothetical protein
MTADGAAIQAFSITASPAWTGGKVNRTIMTRIEESITLLDDNKRLTPRRQRALLPFVGRWWWDACGDLVAGDWNPARFSQGI